ncbi:MAG: hypothetical protein EBT08_07965, partial [Betaproteobacteria bacterium]|nr:hypothetical protein [Betaproteobacteria bacterium]
TYGYIVFSYDSTTKLLQAKKRYKYSYDATTYKATYTQDTAFAAADFYVNLTSGVYKLVSGTTSATKLYLYGSPIDFNVPTDFNPAITAYQTNADQPFAYKAAAQSSLVEGTTGSVYKSLSTNTTYQNQVKTVGSRAPWSATRLPTARPGAISCLTSTSPTTRRPAFTTRS